jgi:predicted DNA-binding protein (UPF0251 family)
MRKGRGQAFGRPRTIKYLDFNPQVRYFKPKGVPLSILEEIILTNEELEALRLKNLEGLDQTECAKRMRTSQSTFQRILALAYKKMSEALIKGKAIKIIDT